MILFTAMGYAQSPAPTPVQPVTKTAPVQTEQLTDLEKAGLQSIAQQYQQLMSNLSQANISITKTHPGYHLDPQNPFSGNLVKNEPAKEAPKTEVPKPAETPVTPAKK